VEAYVRLLTDAVRAHWKRMEAPPPTVMAEPGRSIVGEAGVTIYRIGTVKDIPGVRVYASVDGGMTDNPRAALYQARYHGRLANRMREDATGLVSIAGKCCETGDMIAWDVPLPEPHPGDLLAIFSTGAYHYAMSSNYNRIPRPPILLVSGGHADLLVRGETYEDVMSHDVIPARLAEGSAAAPANAARPTEPL
jgi:diaminopimelate decarboxylase